MRSKHRIDANKELARLRALCANVKSMMEATARNFNHKIGDQCGCWICLCIRDLNAAAGRGEGDV